MEKEKIQKMIVENTMYDLEETLEKLKKELGKDEITASDLVKHIHNKLNLDFNQPLKSTKAEDHIPIIAKIFGVGEDQIEIKGNSVIINHEIKVVEITLPIKED